MKQKNLLEKIGLKHIMNTISFTKAGWVKFLYQEVQLHTIETRAG